MSTATLNKKVPDLTLPATDNQDFSFSTHRGYRLVLYFYPKDSTPGCTLEGRDFRDNIRKFSARKTRVFGVSRDSLASHERFKEKQQFPFQLISDHDEKLCAMFDVIKGKTMFGKKVRGIQRSTFLIDEAGILRREWRKVSIRGHADEVLAAIKEL